MCVCVCGGAESSQTLAMLEFVVLCSVISRVASQQLQQIGPFIRMFIFLFSANSVLARGKTDADVIIVCSEIIWQLL